MNQANASSMQGVPMSEAVDPNKRFVEFEAGQVVMKEGTLGEGLYILMSGELEVLVKGVKVAQINAKGSYVGEIASLLRCRRIATVKAVTPCKFLIVGNITRYFEENASAALGIAQTLAARIMDMNSKIVAYQGEIGKWVQQGEDAIKSQDLSPFTAMLREMQKLLHESKPEAKAED